MSRIIMFDMNVIGLIFLQFAVGEGFQLGNSNEYLFNFTKIKLRADYIKSEVLIRDKCILKLLKEAIKQFGSTYMFITDGHYHTSLLNNLQSKFVHSYYTEPGLLSQSKSETFDNLLIFRKKIKLSEVIKKKEPFQATKFFLLVRDYEDAVRQFEILWEKRLVNVVASFVMNTTVYYYTYFPYCTNHCGGVGKPFELAKCDITNGIFSHREKLFPRKVYNLHGCPIKISITEKVPAAYYTDKKKLTGWEVELLNEILDRMNGVPSYSILNSKEPVYKRSLGYTRLVEDSEIGGGLAVSLRGLVKTDFVMYGKSMCSTWVVPRKEGSGLSFDFLTKVFPRSVWILLLLAYTTMAVAIRAFFNVRCENIIFKLLPYLFGTTTPTKRTSRFFGAIWLLFCLHMTAVYQSGIQSALLVPRSPTQLSTTSDVLNSNLKILGVNDIITDAMPFFKKRYNLTNRRYRNRKLSYEDWIYRMVIKKDSAYLGFRETVLYNTQRTDFADKIYVSDNCVIRYLLAFVLKKNSHLSESVVKFSNMLNENGVLEHFIRKHLKNESRENLPKKLTTILKPRHVGEGDEMPPPINMEKISVVFKCLLTGITMASAAFIAELMTTWNWEKIKKRVLRELQRACPCY